MSEPPEAGRLDPGLVPFLPGFRGVQRLVDLAGGFVLVPVEVPGPDVAHGLAGWLRDRGYTTTLVEPRDDEEAWRRLAATLLSVEAAPRHVALVVGRGPHEGAAQGSWAKGVEVGLRLLNQQRDSIIKHLGCPLLWCGPAWFLQLTWQSAPDFWSVRAVERRLEPGKERGQQEAEQGFDAAKKPRHPLRDLYEAARAQVDVLSAARFAVTLVSRLIDERQREEARALIHEALGLLDQRKEELEGVPSGETQARAMRGQAADLRAVLLLQRAELARGDGNLIASLGTIALVLARAELSPYMRVRAQLATASLLEDAGELEESRELYSVALTLAMEHADFDGQARALIGIGSIEARLDRFYGTPLAQIEFARTIAQSLGSGWLEATVLTALAAAQARLHDKRGARESLAAADAVLASTGGLNDAHPHIGGPSLERARADALAVLDALDRPALGEPHASRGAAPDVRPDAVQDNHRLDELKK